MFDVTDNSFLNLNSDQVFELVNSNQMTLDQFQEWLENRVHTAQEDGAFNQSFYSM